MQKTNAMRMLDKNGIAHEIFTYPHSGTALEGGEVARLMGQSEQEVFKTLATLGADGRSVFVFVIPVCCELDLKAAARAVGEKSVSMIPVAKLLASIGYQRGACTPIGMKKDFPVVVDASAQRLSQMFISGGAIGTQIKLSPTDLMSCCKGKYADIIRQ